MPKTNKVTSLTEEIARLRKESASLSGSRGGVSRLTILESIDDFNDISEQIQNKDFVDSAMSDAIETIQSILDEFNRPDLSVRERKDLAKRLNVAEKQLNITEVSTLPPETQGYYTAAKAEILEHVQKFKKFARRGTTKFEPATQVAKFGATQAVSKITEVLSVNPLISAGLQMGTDFISDRINKWRDRREQVLQTQRKKIHELKQQKSIGDDLAEELSDFVDMDTGIPKKPKQAAGPKPTSVAEDAGIMQAFLEGYFTSFQNELEEIKDTLKIGQEPIDEIKESLDGIQKDTHEQTQIDKKVTKHFREDRREAGLTNWREKAAAGTAAIKSTFKSSKLVQGFNVVRGLMSNFSDIMLKLAGGGAVIASLFGAGGVMSKILVASRGVLVFMGTWGAIGLGILAALKLLKDFWIKFREEGVGFKEALKYAYDELKAAVIELMKKYLGIDPTKAFEAIEQTGQWLVQGITTVGGWIWKAVEPVTKFFTDIGIGTMEVIDKIKSFASNFSFTEQWENLKTTFDNITLTIVGGILKVKDFFANFSFTEQWENLKTAFNNIGESFKEEVKKIPEWFKRLGKMFGNATKKLGKWFRNLPSRLWKWLTDKLNFFSDDKPKTEDDSPGAWEGVKNFFGFGDKDVEKPVIEIPEGGQVAAAGMAPLSETLSGKAPMKAEILGSSPYDAIINEKAAQYGVDPNLVRAVMKAESSFDPNAKSGKGALGLMQIMPKTAGDYGYSAQDMMDPEKNIDAGVRHLAMLQKLNVNKTKGKTDTDKVLASYNWGQGNLEDVHGNIKQAPKETRNYVRRVGQYKAEYDQQVPVQPETPTYAVKPQASPMDDVTMAQATLDRRSVRQKDSSVVNINNNNFGGGGGGIGQMGRAAQTPPVTEEHTLRRRASLL